MEVERCHHICIVERSPSHLCASQLHRVHVCNRRYGTCSAHLEDHLPERCLGLFCLKLIGDCPSWALCRHAEALLLRQRIDFQNNTIGSHGQVAAFLVPIINEGKHVVERVGQRHAFTDLKSPSCCCLEVLIVSIAGNTIAQEVVEIGIQASLSHRAAVFALESARSSISGIGKKRFACLLPFCIETFERCPRHQNLATNLKLAGPVSTFGELQRNAANGTHISRHIVALSAIASRHSPRQASVFIVKADAQTVELQFATDLKRCPHQTIAHPFPEISHLLSVVSIAQRKHWSGMHNRLELIVEVAAHPLSGAVCIEKFRMFCFEVLQFVHQEIELLIGNHRTVLHIVAVVMLVQLIAELHDACFFVHRIHIITAQIY